MRFAVISDIHSNIEALTSVFADIDERGIDRIFCLGDVIGYGPDPEPCVDLIAKRCEFTIRGNHDDALFTSADRFNPYARNALNWTRDRLAPGFFRPRANRTRWKFLQNLELDKRIGELYFVHGSPRDPVNEYIYREDVFFNAEGKLKTIFQKVDRALFVGHTHLPMVLTDSLKSFVPEEDGASFDLEEERYIINVGSVGQPRDRDTRACYVEYDEGRITFHRVVYDIDAVVARIESCRALDPVLGTRLRDGM